jgi:hypothetical protein
VWWCRVTGSGTARGGVGFLDSPLSVNELMVAWVDQSSHELWDREKEGRAPKSEPEWEEVERHGVRRYDAYCIMAISPMSMWNC